MKFAPILVAATVGLFLGPSAHAGSPHYVADAGPDGPIVVAVVRVYEDGCHIPGSPYLDIDAWVPHGLEWGASHAFQAAGQAHQFIEWTIVYQSGGALKSESYTTALGSIATTTHDDHGHAIIVNVTICLSSPIDSGTPFIVEAAFVRGP